MMVLKHIGSQWSRLWMSSELERQVLAVRAKGKFTSKGKDVGDYVE